MNPMDFDNMEGIDDFIDGVQSCFITGIIIGIAVCGLILWTLLS